MNAWINVWTVTFILGMILFALLAVVVTIRGMSDIRSLFRYIAEQHARSSEDRGRSDSSGPEHRDI